MIETSQATPLVLDLTAVDFCPNGARHNSIIAGVVRVANEWIATIKVVWNASRQEPVTSPEPVLEMPSILIWRAETVESADNEIVRAAWLLGAWDVQRCWHQPLGSHADPYSPHHGLVSLLDISNAFTVRSFGPRGFPPQQVDAKKQIEFAAQEGWISWKFRPTLRSSRVGGRVAARDMTLAIDGTRTTPCCYQHKVLVRGERSIIQLGREKKSSGDPWALDNQGATLRDARQRLGLSADGLANKLRLGSNGGRTIRRWEAGEVPVSGPAQVVIELLVGGRLSGQ
jgi:hypothetical protein